MRGDGEIGLTYYDFRGESASGTSSVSVWLSRSSDGGATWTETQIDGPFNLSLAPLVQGQRFLGDYGLNLAENPVKKDLPPLNGRNVAIVGSGPGGLACAYHLRRRGYASVIFEALAKPGGMLRAGIPAWHLPEDILDAEIA